MEHFSDMMILLVMMHSGRLNSPTFTGVHVNVAIILMSILLGEYFYF